MNILGVKKDHLAPSKLSFSQETKIFINERLCPNYKNIWNKCKKFMAKIKTVCLLALMEIVWVTLEGKSLP